MSWCAMHACIGNLRRRRRRRDWRWSSRWTPAAPPSRSAARCVTTAKRAPSKAASAPVASPARLLDPSPADGPSTWSGTVYAVADFDIRHDRPDSRTSLRAEGDLITTGLAMHAGGLMVGEADSVWKGSLTLSGPALGIPQRVYFQGALDVSAARVEDASGASGASVSGFHWDGIGGWHGVPVAAGEGSAESVEYFGRLAGDETMHVDLDRVQLRGDSGRFRPLPPRAPPGPQPARQTRGRRSRYSGTEPGGPGNPGGLGRAPGRARGRGKPGSDYRRRSGGPTLVGGTSRAPGSGDRPRCPRTGGRRGPGEPRRARPPPFARKRSEHEWRRSTSTRGTDSKSVSPRWRRWSTAPTRDERRESGTCGGNRSQWIARACWRRKSCTPRALPLRTKRTGAGRDTTSRRSDCACTPETTKAGEAALDTLVYRTVEGERLEAAGLLADSLELQSDAGAAERFEADSLRFEGHPRRFLGSARPFALGGRIGRAGGDASAAQSAAARLRYRSPEGERWRFAELDLGAADSRPRGAPSGSRMRARKRHP